MAHDHSHAHGHAHAHAHDHGGDPRRALAWALGLNGGFLVIEGVVGLLTGSLALLSDAAHMLSDVGALVLALVAAQLATLPRGGSRTYGLARAEVLGAFVNGLTLLVACGGIAWEAIGRLRSGPPEIPGWPMIVVASIGLAINLGSAWQLSRARGGLNLRAALVHMLADAVGSAGAIVAGVLVLYGLPGADAAVSLGISALILWGTFGLLRDSARVLLEVAPAGLSVDEVQRALAEVPGVLDVHDLHVWTLSGEEPLLTAHIGASPDDPSVAPRARRVLAERFQIRHATLQVEPHGACEGACAEPEQVT